MESLGEADLIGHHAAGIQEISLEDIVGSVDRTDDFDTCFRPRCAEQRRRIAALRHAFAVREMPPISVYEIDGQYFVRDGHHRVALAHERGMLYIDAEVVRIRTRARA